MRSSTRNNLLIAGILIVAVLSYDLAIRKTLDLREKHIQLTQKASMFDNGSSQLALLKQKEIYYDSILLSHPLNGSSIQNKLLKMINTFGKTNNLKLLNFLAPHRFQDKEVEIKTYQFKLKGDYNSIISFIHKLEKETKLGEVVNLEFERKENFRTGKRSLEAKVMLKSFN